MKKAAQIKSIHRKNTACEIVAVSGANDAHDFTGNAEELFTGGICPSCRHGTGERTDVPLAVSGGPPAGADGGFVRVRIASPFVTFSVEIFSTEFIAALAADEKRRFKWLPVNFGKKSKKAFLSH